MATDLVLEQIYPYAELPPGALFCPHGENPRLTRLAHIKPESGNDTLTCSRTVVKMAWSPWHTNTGSTIRFEDDDLVTLMSLPTD